MAWYPPSSGTPFYQDEASVSRQSEHREYLGPLPLQYPNSHSQWEMYAAQHQLSRSQYGGSDHHQTGQPYSQELQREHQGQHAGWLNDQQQHHGHGHGHQHQHHYEQGYHQQRHEDRSWDQAHHQQQYSIQQHDQYHQQQHEDRSWGQAHHQQQYSIQQHDQYHQQQHEDHSWGQAYHQQQQCPPQQHDRSQVHQQSALRTFATGPYQHVLVPHGYEWQAADCNFDELTDYDTSATEQRTHRSRRHIQDQFLGGRYPGMAANSQEEETQDCEQKRYYDSNDELDHDGSECWSDGPHIYPRSPAQTRRQLAVSPPNLDAASISTPHSTFSLQNSSILLPSPSADSGGNLCPPTVASDDYGEDDIQDQQKGSKRYRAWSEDECQRLMTCVATQTQEASRARAMRAAAVRSQKPGSITSDGTENNALGPVPPKGKDWQRIAELMGNGRTWAGCSNKYQKIMRQARVE